jgi:hypothetical protein
MKTAPARWPPGTGTQPEVLIKEARRRQRRRYVAVGVAVVAVLGGAAGVAGLHGPGSRPGPRSHAGSPVAARHAARAPGPIPRSVDTTVLMWPAGFGQCCGPVAVDSLSTGRLAQSQEPAISVGDYQPLLTQVGRWLVYVGNRATAIRDDLSGSPRVLGPTPFFAPSAAPGHVWLFRSRNGTQGPIQAWQVPVAGGAPSPPVTLPAGADLLRGTDAGLLLQVPQGLALWDPGGTPRSLPHSPPGGISDGFDATARLVAYGTGCTSQATAPDAASEHERTAGLARPVPGDDPAGAGRASRVLCGDLAGAGEGGGHGRAPRWPRLWHRQRHLRRDGGRTGTRPPQRGRDGRCGG